MRSLGLGFYFIVLAVELCSHPEAVDCKKAKPLQNNKSIATVRFLKAIGSKFSDFKSDIKDMRTYLEQINKTCNSNVCEFLWDAKSKEIVDPKEIAPVIKYAKKSVCSAISQIFSDITSLNEKRKTLEQSHALMKTNITEISPKVENHDTVLKTLNKSLTDLKNQSNGCCATTESNKEELDKLKKSMQTLQKHVCALKECPPGWTKRCPSCYLFKSEALNWTEAVENCTMEEAYLVEYDGKDEVTFVLNLVLRKKMDWGKSKYAGFWAGGSDRKKEGEWFWRKSGRRINSSFKYWLPRQPDNYNSEDCMSSTVNRDGQWNDGDCSNLKTFVCEKYLFDNN